MTVEEYATTFLQQEISLVKDKIEPLLTEFEKAIIYKYSEDGYNAINEELRVSQGRSFSLFAKLLDECLAKLPSYNGIVYRGVVNLSQTEVKKYIEAFKEDELITEYTFYSTSITKEKANEFGRISIKIFSKTGKLIQHITKFDEKEVLFRCKTQFRVTDCVLDESGNLVGINLTEMRT